MGFLVELLSADPLIRGSNLIADQHQKIETAVEKMYYGKLVCLSLSDTSTQV
jgi:hypothetical protein